MADWFGVEVAPPLKVPLLTFMPQHKETWNHIRQKYHLKDVPYDKVCSLVSLVQLEMLVQLSSDWSSAALFLMSDMICPIMQSCRLPVGALYMNGSAVMYHVRATAEELTSVCMCAAAPVRLC